MPSQKEVYIKVYKQENQNVSSLYFDGLPILGASYAQLPALGFSGTNVDLTFQVWTKANATTGVMDIFGLDTNERFIVRLENSSNLKVSGVGVSGSLTGGNFTPIPNFYGNWVHISVVYTYGDKTVKVYGNGVLLNTFACGEQIQFGSNLTGTLARFSPTYYGYAFKGWMDEVRIWNIARTQTEIQSDMYSKLVGSETGLIAYYRCDDSSGSVLADSTSNARNGTIINAAAWSTTDYAPITKTTYKGFFYDFGISNFSTSLNGGLGNLTLTVPRKFDNFGEGSVIDFNNEVRVFVYDQEANQGVQIYTGYIIGYSAEARGSETVAVDVAGYISRFERDVYRDNSGNYKKSYSSTEIGAVMRDIIDRYRQYNSGTSINYSSTSIANTSKNRGITFNNNTYLDALKYTFELTDVNWYWYIDTDNLVYLQQIPTTPTHLFMFGKDIIDIKFDKSISQTTNGMLFWNGLASSDANYIAKSYSDSASQTTYGRLVEIKNDNRYRDVNSANDYASRYLGNYKNPFNTVELEIADSNFGAGYDIESIKPGQTCKVRNIDSNNALSGNMLITKVTYNFTSAKIVVADVKTYIERTAFELSKKQQEGKYQTDGPNAYS